MTESYVSRNNQRKRLIEILREMADFRAHTALRENRILTPEEYADGFIERGVRVIDLTVLKNIGQHIDNKCACDHPSIKEFWKSMDLITEFAAEEGLANEST